MNLSYSIVLSQNSTVPYDSKDYICSESSKWHNNLSVESIEKVVLFKCKSTHLVWYL